MSIVKAFGGDVDMMGNALLNVIINDATASNQPVNKGQLDNKVPANIKLRINGVTLQASIDNGATWKTVNLT